MIVESPKGSTPLFLGDKTVEDLQLNVKISDENVISGSLKYIESFPEFWLGQGDRAGNYLALQFPQSKSHEVTVTLSNSMSIGTVTLDEDELWVGYIHDKSQIITVTVDGDLKSQKVLTLTGVNLKKTT